MKHYHLFILLSILSSCINVTSQSVSQDKKEIREGNIVVKVCTRGCYQYVLESEGEIYFPTNLAEEYKILETIPVNFDGEILETTTDITKPAPTDQPMYDFTCQNIELSFIEKRKE